MKIYHHFLLILALWGIDIHGEKGPDFTVPLKNDGSDYPCRGLGDTLFNSTTQLQAGGGYTIRTEGRRPEGSYGGGSCQIALSYDDGKTFKVIKSIIGSCPDGGSYYFTIPRDAPAGGVLMTWTWFNRRGFPEMYMLCEQMALSNSTAATQTHTDDGSSKDGEPMQEDETPRTGFDNLPELFIANIDDDAQCKTVEGQEVVFPDPGTDIQYGEEVLDSGNKGYTCGETPPSSAATPPITTTTTTTTQPRSSSVDEAAWTLYLVMGRQGRFKTVDTMTIDGGTTGTRATASAPPPWISEFSILPPLRTTPVAQEKVVVSESCVPGATRCESETESSHTLCSEQGEYVHQGSLERGYHCRDNHVLFDN